jgi:HSP20 family protein
MAEKKRKEGQQASKELIPRDFFDFSPFQNVGRMFGSMPMFRRGAFGRAPNIDLVEEGNKIRVKADLPGVDKNEIKLNITKNSISIRAATKKEERREGKNYYYMERSASGYFRTIPLPSEVDPRTARAKFYNGTLEIEVNKHGKSEGREIKVE